MPRIPVVAGNWKMYKTIGEAIDLARQLKLGAEHVVGRDVVVAPPFTALAEVARILQGSKLALAAQNACWENEGAYTGEISPVMVRDAGCTYAIVGHSERRHIFGETDMMIARKLKAVVSAGLKPIFCIGETIDERRAGQTWAVLEDQATRGLALIQPEEMSQMVIAYEPVWAIGTGLTATNEQAQEAHVFVRSLVERLFEKDIAADFRILYGGSVKSENVDGLMAQPDIDGVLVGGASLEARSFSRIINYKD